MTTNDIQDKLNRLEAENIRLRSLLTKEIEINRTLKLSIDKAHFLTRLLKKIFK